MSDDEYYNEYNDDYEEKDLLLNADEENKAEGNENVTKWREVFIILSIVALQFFAFCTETIIFPFFPTVASSRGISSTLIGVVFAVYDLSRVLTSPLFASLVSLK